MVERRVRERKPLRARVDETADESVPRKAYVQAGAGIVYDSDPSKEWEESLSKSAALRYSVGLAKELLEKRTF